MRSDAKGQHDPITIRTCVPRYDRSAQPHREHEPDWLWCAIDHVVRLVLRVLVTGTLRLCARLVESVPYLSRSLLCWRDAF